MFVGQRLLSLQDKDRGGFADVRPRALDIVAAFQGQPDFRSRQCHSDLALGLLLVHKLNVIPLAGSLVTHQIAGYLVFECFVNVRVAVSVDLPQCRYAFVIHDDGTHHQVLIPGRHPPFVGRVIHGNGGLPVRPGRLSRSGRPGWAGWNKQQTTQCQNKCDQSAYKRLASLMSYHNPQIRIGEATFIIGRMAYFSISICQ
jgi:hypothetical protein